MSVEGGHMNMHLSNIHTLHMWAWDVANGYKYKGLSDDERWEFVGIVECLELIIRRKQRKTGGKYDR